MTSNNVNPPPQEAVSALPDETRNAVLVQSEAMPEGAPKVEDFDFNKFKGRPITAEDLLLGMQNMGFQASSIGDAVRIINGMVSPPPHCQPSFPSCIQAYI
jgi:deoxyhypusine synthase